MNYLRNQPNSPPNCSFGSSVSLDCCSSSRSRCSNCRAARFPVWRQGMTTWSSPRPHESPPPRRYWNCLWCHCCWSDDGQCSSRNSRCDFQFPRWSSGSGRSYVADCERDREMSPSGSIRSVSRGPYDLWRCKYRQRAYVRRLQEGTSYSAHPHDQRVPFHTVDSNSRSRGTNSDLLQRIDPLDHGAGRCLSFFFSIKALDQISSCCTNFFLLIVLVFFYYFTDSAIEKRVLEGLNFKGCDFKFVSGIDMETDLCQMGRTVSFSTEIEYFKSTLFLMKSYWNLGFSLNRNIIFSGCLYIIHYFNRNLIKLSSVFFVQE